MFSKEELHERIEKMTQDELAELIALLYCYHVEQLPEGSVMIYQNGDPVAIQIPIK